MAAKKQNSKPRSIPSSESNLSTLLSVIDSSKPMESAGEALGRKLGAYAGRLLGRISGTGDYSVNLPSGGVDITPSVVPEFIRTDNTRETRIRHREYLGDITAHSVAGLFKNSSYRLNPGSFSTFPWLSIIAQQYEQWEPHGIAVIFKSLTSTYAASQSLGTIIIATDYDVSDAMYQSKIEMDNSEFAVSGSAATNLLHPIECNDKERLTKLFFVQSDSSVTTDNRKWSDLGNLQIASAGCLSNQLLGEIWITYDISFYKPQINNLGSNLLFTGWRSTAITTTTDIFGTSGVLTFRANSNLDIYPTGSNTLSINPSLIGRTFLATLVNSSGGAYNQVALTQNTVASNGAWLLELNSPYVTSFGGGQNGNAVSNFLFQVIAPTASGRHLLVFNTLSGTCVWTAGIYCYIVEVNPNLQVDY